MRTCLLRTQKVEGAVHDGSIGQVAVPLPVSPPWPRHSERMLGFNSGRRKVGGGKVAHLAQKRHSLTSLLIAAQIS